MLAPGGQLLWPCVTTLSGQVGHTNVCVQARKLKLLYDMPLLSSQQPLAQRSWAPPLASLPASYRQPPPRTASAAPDADQPGPSDCPETSQMQVCLSASASGLWSCCLSLCMGRRRFVLG